MKFRTKIALCMIAILSVLFGTGGSLLLSASFGQSLEREQDRAYEAYQTLAGTLRIIGDINGNLIYEDIADIVTKIKGESAVSWEMLRFRTENGTIYESGNTDIKASKGTPDAGVCEIRCVSEGGKNLLILSGVLTTEEDMVRMDMARDITGIFRERQSWQNIYQWVFLVMTAVCAVVSYSMAGILTRPLKRLSKTARQISGGQLSSRADVSGRDEVGLLAEDFNKMADHLEKTICMLREENESQERFIGSFSHELKTPMTSIIGYADLIRGGTLGAEEQAEAADYIVNEGKRLENLSMKLLNIMTVKYDRSAFVMASPAVIVQSAAERMTPLYRERNISLQYRTEEGECVLEPDLVCSLVLNLMDNAAKALPENGGCISVIQEMRLEGCRIFVRDNGRGIPEESIRHLTEAFYRVDRSRSRRAGGVGLGLALCREIADAHGGYLRFKSRLGTGTVVMAVLKGGRSEEEK